MQTIWFWNGSWAYCRQWKNFIKQKVSSWHFLFVFVNFGEVGWRSVGRMNIWPLNYSLTRSMEQLWIFSALEWFCSRFGIILITFDWLLWFLDYEKTTCWNWRICYTASTNWLHSGSRDRLSSTAEWCTIIFDSLSSPMLWIWSWKSSIFGWCSRSALLFISI